MVDQLGSGVRENRYHPDVDGDRMVLHTAPSSRYFDMAVFIQSFMGDVTSKFSKYNNILLLILFKPISECRVFLGLDTICVDHCSQFLTTGR